MFNIVGAVLQGVLPTMIILAVYYTLADIVLLGQCFYYRGFTLSDYAQEEDNAKPSSTVAREQADIAVEEANERTALLGNGHSRGNGYASSSADHHEQLHEHRPRRLTLTQVDVSHLSPATPFVGPAPLSPPSSETDDESATRPAPRDRISPFRAALLNTSAILLVCAAGVLGWWISNRVSHSHGNDGNDEEGGRPTQVTFDVLGQIFGYLCAALYLGSRLPQLLLNYRRKSTEGVSMLFFLFACIGNLTYVLSIFAYSPVCERTQCRPGEAERAYGMYILVNLSWLLGSLGTLLLDMAIFVQFFLYRKNGDDDDEL